MARDAVGLRREGKQNQERERERGKGRETKESQSIPGRKNEELPPRTRIGMSIKPKGKDIRPSSDQVRKVKNVCGY